MYSLLMILFFIVISICSKDKEIKPLTREKNKLGDLNIEKVDIDKLLNILNEPNNDSIEKENYITNKQHKDEDEEIGLIYENKDHKVKQENNYKDYNYNIFKENYELFKKELDIRDIKYLIHFTNIYNLKKIIDSGFIISRYELSKKSNDFINNDIVRFDGSTHINLSIEHPNIFLLQRYKENNKNAIWCILRINKKYIYYKDSLFSVTNAANSYCKNIIGISGDFQKFKQLFSPIVEYETTMGKRRFSRYNITKEKYPTDIQAEVLVRDKIPISDIVEICCENYSDMIKIKNILQDYDIKVIIDTSLFKKERL